MPEKDEAFKIMRKEYRLEHGHFPENYKAKIDCETCQINDLLTHTCIATQAGAKRDEYIDKTNYDQKIKDTVKLKLAK